MSTCGSKEYYFFIVKEIVELRKYINVVFGWGDLAKKKRDKREKEEKEKK